MTADLKICRIQNLLENTLTKDLYGKKVAPPCYIDRVSW